ncbi:MAG: sensor histidine kinase [Synechococcus sp.]
MTSTITLQTLQARMAEGLDAGRVDDATARRLWWAALETIQTELLPVTSNTPPQGVWIAAPLPALYDPGLLTGLKGWVWTPDQLNWSTGRGSGLLPPDRLDRPGHTTTSTYQRLSLLESDGLDPLLIVITAERQVALALHGEHDRRQLLMRSDPETLGALLAMLDQRLQQQAPDQAMALRRAIGALGPLQSSEQFSQRFWPGLAERLACMAPSLTLQTLQEAATTSNPAEAELSLLEAITHEVRTPLATIRTLIRSLLRRKDLAAVVQKRLQQIDSECTEQIDRFGLIFHAAELQRQSPQPEALARTDLGRMLEELAPGWEQQLQRRGLTLRLDLSANLPAVLSDPGRLEPMLGGLIDRSCRGLPEGAELLVQLRPAGARLKLHLRGRLRDGDAAAGTAERTAKLGPVLSWNPGTGSLQLSQGATRQLLASLGGRLIQQRNRGLTVLFPVA